MDTDLHPRPPLPGTDAEEMHDGFPPPPPPIQTADKKMRRPRARQVSSRYLSPSPSPSPSSNSSTETLNPAACLRNPYTTPYLKNAHHNSHHRTPHQSSPFPVEADENHTLASIRRGTEIPLPFSSSAAKTAGPIKKKAVVRLFTDNNHQQHPADHPPPRPADPKRRLRPGSPVVHPVSKPQTPIPGRVSHFPFDGSSDNRLEETSSEASFSDVETSSVSSLGGYCDSPPLLPPPSCRLRATADVRSSMPEADLRRQDSQDASCRASTNSLCLRSLGSISTAGQQQHPFNLSKPVNRPLIYSKPPHHPSTRPVAESKKGSKLFVRQDDIHMLRLLDNCYVQWRLTNAKAQASSNVRKVAAEKSMYGVSVRNAELQNSVTQKRIQLEELKRRASLFSIITDQMPHLDEWSILEDDYSSSLVGATKALENATLRFPVTGNVKVDTGEIKKVIDSALGMLESLYPSVERFLTKAEDTDDIASALATTISAQKILIEECGSLLSEAHNLQVKECSLRVQHMQSK